MAMLVLALVFNIIIILLIAISILLIYSLLMNSVETKTFENGIMRLVGFTKPGYVSLILTQAFMFVLPSILMGYAASYPLLWYCYKYLLHADMQSISIVPGLKATGQASLVGLLIPILSSIIPV